MQYCKLYRSDGNALINIMDLYTDSNGQEHIEIRIEKENDMDSYARFILPANCCTHAYGFPETELMYLKKFLRNNALTIWDMAKGGVYTCRRLLLITWDMVRLRLF
ncbi:MAG: hypothetical protein IKN43_05220 [Selenomonadaceae bacterium]|nr:hypothetical protein [Selenomonadaceae bacterium]